MWYVLARYLGCVTGKNYVSIPENYDQDDWSQSSASLTPADKSRPSSSSRPPSRNQEDVKIKTENGDTLMKEVKIQLMRLDESIIKSCGEEKLKTKPKKMSRKSSVDSNVDSKKALKDSDGSNKKWVHLTKWELEGLIQLVGKVQTFPLHKRGVPKDLSDPDGLLADVKVCSLIQVTF